MTRDEDVLRAALHEGAARITDDSLRRPTLPEPAPRRFPALAAAASVAAVAALSAVLLPGTGVSPASGQPPTTTTYAFPTTLLLTDANGLPPWPYNVEWNVIGVEGGLERPPSEPYISVSLCQVGDPVKPALFCRASFSGKALEMGQEFAETPWEHEVSDAIRVLMDNPALMIEIRGDKLYLAAGDLTLVSDY